MKESKGITISLTSNKDMGYTRLNSILNEIHPLVDQQAEVRSVLCEKLRINLEKICIEIISLVSVNNLAATAKLSRRGMAR